MKKIIIAILLLSSCVNNKNTTQQNKEDLVLKEAYTQYITGGKESIDGTHSSNNYSFVFEEINDIEIKAVWINKVAYKFETFDHEGLYYVTVQVYHQNKDNVVEMKLPLHTKSQGVVMYRKNNENYFLEVPSFEKKSSVIAQ